MTVHALRIAIIGSPRAGKTTLALRLAAELGLPVLHSDDLAWLGWHECSAEVARRMREPVAGIYEGVAVVRALRKNLLQLQLAPPGSRPAERVIVLTRPRLALEPGQETMRKACASILAAIEAELRVRGTAIEYDPPDPPEAPAP
jgi:hypothetical protein